MSENTKIEWATHSWNPWIGCTKVSPGCKFCYAEHSTPTRVARKAGRELWGKGQARQRTSAAYWKQPAKWNREAYKFAESALGYGTSTGMHEAARQRVFPSLCDWLDDEVPFEWFADLMHLIRLTPNLDWLLLTKRPENWKLRIQLANGQLASIGNIEHPDTDSYLLTAYMLADWLENKPPENVWIGTSVEDQTRADERIPELLKIPTKVRFLSVEPLLGPIRFSGVPGFNKAGSIGQEILKNFWVIIGGESGPGARPCNVDWIRDIVRQCNAASVPCFVKQLGSFSIQERGSQRSRNLFDAKKGGDPSEWPEDLRVREFPKVT